MASNRSFLGYLFTPAHLRASSNRSPLPKAASQIQIDTSRNLKSHLSYCKHGASPFSDRQSFSHIGVHFTFRLHGHSLPSSLRRTGPPAHPICVRCYIRYIQRRTTTLPQVKLDD